MKKKKKTTKKAISKNPRVAKLSLVDSQFSTEQVLRLLQRTPEKYTYQRKGKGGKMFTYVPGGYVKKALNYAFGWLWDFEVKAHGEKEGHIWVLGRLTIKNKKLEPVIIKEQFGRAEVKRLKDGGGYLDYGNDLKSATTDSMKKCASLIGIASDIYDQEEYQDISKEILDSLPKPKIDPKSILKKKKNKNPKKEEKAKEGENITPEVGDYTIEEIKKMEW